MSKKNLSQNMGIKRKQRGVSLLELLLSIGILSSLFTVGSYITGQYTRLITNEKAARQMLIVQSAGEEYARTNFELLTDTTSGTMRTPGDLMPLTIADLIADNFLPASFSDTNTLRLRMQVYLRNTTNLAAGSLPSIDVITVTLPADAGTTGQSFDRLADTAQFGKGKLGILSNLAGTIYDRNSFTSTSEQWKVQLADIGSTYNPPRPSVASGDPSGYIAAYGVVSSENIFDNNILYRIPVDGQPELNQMSADLNMNGKNINGIGTLTVDNLSTSSNMVINNTAGGYAFTADGNINIENSINLNSRTAQPGGASSMTIYADNDNTTNDLIADRIAITGGTLTTRAIATDTTPVGLGQMRIRTGLTTRNLNTTGVVAASRNDFVVNDTMNVDNAIITTRDFQLSGSGTALTTNTLTVEDQIVAGKTEVNNSLVANSNGSHQVADQLLLEGGGAANPPVIIRTMAAQEVRFGDLCYTGGAADDIEACP